MLNRRYFVLPVFKISMSKGRVEKEPENLLLLEEGRLFLIYRVRDVGLRSRLRLVRRDSSLLLLFSFLSHERWRCRGDVLWMWNGLAVVVVASGVAFDEKLIVVSSDTLRSTRTVW